MFIKAFTLFVLLVELLSLYDLSTINDNNNQHQLKITKSFVNQPTLSTSLSTVSMKMRWVKTLKNITETNDRTVVLECQVKSSYPVKFNWYRYNNPIDRTRFIITENNLRSSIRLRNFKESISGFYTCEVSNGYETLTSTGFVRSKYPNINPIDFKDDLLPSNEFQPEIISPIDPLFSDVKCEPYSGTICRSILRSKYVSITNLDIEQNLINHIKYLSNQCQQILLPMICLFVYPICDENHHQTQSICRKSCYFFQNHSCMKQFTTSYQIPTCENLPPSSDDSTCFAIEQARKPIPSLIERLFSSFNSLSLVLFSALIPIVILCSIIFIYYYCTCRKRTTTNKSLRFFSSPFHQHITSSSLSTTNTNYSHRKIDLNSFPSAIGQILGDISFSNIRFLEEIGQGEFGRIFLGEIVDRKCQCIIKTLENERHKQDYLREIEIFGHIHHVNISNLIGICIEPENAFSLMMNEYLNHGDLHDYLIVQRLKPIDRTDFLYISIQIVSGMIYLSERNIFHNDLSTRNIFISEQLNIKITNIARYRRKYHFDYYKLANRLLPVRWMSIESLLSGIYSEMSDVWSFGVLLWEMFSYGIQPYFGKTNPEVIEMVRDRILLPCPMHCSKQIYALMCSCWEEMSEQRPRFNELMRKLRQLEEKSTTTSSSIEEELISIKQIDVPCRNSTRLEI